jgi:hypothetical protein
MASIDSRKHDLASDRRERGVAVRGASLRIAE